MKIDSKYDIIVIGAGVGGLVSAALLSDLGKKVLIIEKESRPGGYLTEFKSEDFIFDVSLHLLNGCGEGRHTYDVFRKCRIVNNIKFLKPKYLYRSIFPDFDLQIPQMNMEAYKEMLNALFPDSKKDIEGLFTEMSKVARAVNDYLSFGHVTSALLPYIGKNYESVIKKYIKNKKLEAIICQLWVYFGLPPSYQRAVDFCYPWFDYTNNGGYYLNKGGAEITRALAARLNHNGVDFLFNKSVDRMSSDNRSRWKVAFGKDDIICETVISDIDLTKTVHGLIGADKFSTQSIKKLSRIVPSISAFEVFLGLNADLKTKYPDDYEIFVNSNYDIEKQYYDCLNNNAKTAPFAITITSNVNSASAPAGKSIVTLSMLAGYQYWSFGSSREYQDNKEKIADILIDRAGKIIPEIKACVEKKIISTPITFERYTNNKDGAISGYARTVGEKNEVRPNDLKDVKNLYFASAWAKQGSGVEKVLYSAEDVYRKISKLAREKVTA